MNKGLGGKALYGTESRRVNNNYNNSISFFLVCVKLKASVLACIVTMGYCKGGDEIYSMNVYSRRAGLL